MDKFKGAFRTPDQFDLIMINLVSGLKEQKDQK